MEKFAPDLRVKQLESRPVAVRCFNGERVLNKNCAEGILWSHSAPALVELLNFPWTCKSKPCSVLFWQGCGMPASLTACVSFAWQLGACLPGLELGTFFFWLTFLNKIQHTALSQNVFVRNNLFKNKNGFLKQIILIILFWKYFRFQIFNKTV